MQVLSKIKIALKKYRQEQQQKNINEMFFNCFPKITKEEAEELKKYIEDKFKKKLVFRRPRMENKAFL